MPVALSVIIPSKTAEVSQTTQYTAPAATRVIIDKFTAINYSGSAATISVNLVNPGGAAGNDNLIVKTRTLQPAETYIFPEIVGHVLEPTGFISTIAGSGSAISIRSSGRLVT